jgi:hypothetical protein
LNLAAGPPSSDRGPPSRTHARAAALSIRDNPERRSCKAVACRVAEDPGGQRRCALREGPLSFPFPESEPSLRSNGRRPPSGSQPARGGNDWLSQGLQRALLRPKIGVHRRCSYSLSVQESFVIQRQDRHSQRRTRRLVSAPLEVKARRGTRAREAGLLRSRVTAIRCVNKLLELPREI